MRVVLDTNCLLKIIFPKSCFKPVWQSFVAEEYTLCVTNEILMEYREILEKYSGSEELAEAVINVIMSSPNVERISPTYRFCLIAEDPDDNKFVDCAITCGASYIVSDDKHFRILKTIDWPKVDLKTLKEFAEEIAGI